MSQGDLYIGPISEGSQMLAVFRFGKQISPANRSLKKALGLQARLERIAMPDSAATRSCMRCGKGFRSEGKANRLCGNCRGKSFDRTML